MFNCCKQKKKIFDFRDLHTLTGLALGMNEKDIDFNIIEKTVALNTDIFQIEIFKTGFLKAEDLAFLIFFLSQTFV